MSATEGGRTGQCHYLSKIFVHAVDPKSGQFDPKSGFTDPDLRDGHLEIEPSFASGGPQSTLYVRHSG